MFFCCAEAIFYKSPISDERIVILFLRSCHLVYTLLVGYEKTCNLKLSELGENTTYTWAEENIFFNSLKEDIIRRSPMRGRFYQKWRMYMTSECPIFSFWNVFLRNVSLSRFRKCLKYYTVCRLSSKDKIIQLCVYNSKIYSTKVL